MSLSLRIGLLLASAIALFFVVFSIRSNKLNTKYSIVWFLWAIFCLIVAAFPEIFYRLSKIAGIELPVNAVFLLMIGLLYALTFYSYLMISKHNDEIIQLTYEVSVLKKELDSLKNKK